MSYRKLSMIVAGALMIASAPVMAQGTTTTIPAKPTGKSDTKPNGAMKPKVQNPGMATEGQSGAEMDMRTAPQSDTAR